MKNAGRSAAPGREIQVVLVDNQARIARRKSPFIRERFGHVLPRHLGPVLPVLRVHEQKLPIDRIAQREAMAIVCARQSIQKKRLPCVRAL